MLKGNHDMRGIFTKEYLTYTLILAACMALGIAGISAGCITYFANEYYGVAGLLFAVSAMGIIAAVICGVAYVLLVPIVTNALLEGEIEQE